MRQHLEMKKMAAAIAAVAGGAALVMAATPASAALSNTKHNLTSTNTSQNRTNGTDEICVFCHTPHGASSVSGGPPLWNKVLPSIGTTYTLYASATLDAATNTAGAPSLACLSCHDGTQAMDNIINAPGSGGYDTTGGGATGLGYTWSGPNVDAQGRLNNGIALLGQDLSNDHPIMIQYCGGGLTGGGNGVATGNCADGDFASGTVANQFGGVVRTQNIAVGAGSVQAFWIDTSTDTARKRNDIILYGRPASGTGTGTIPFVECGSCHDPHVEAGSSGPDGSTAGATFLRTANTGSKVCLSCHIK